MFSLCLNIICITFIMQMWSDKRIWSLLLDLGVFCYISVIGKDSTVFSSPFMPSFRILGFLNQAHRALRFYSFAGSGIKFETLAIHFLYFVDNTLGIGRTPFTCLLGRMTLYFGINSKFNFNVFISLVDHDNFPSILIIIIPRYSKDALVFSLSGLLLLSLPLVKPA